MGVAQLEMALLSPLLLGILLSERPFKVLLISLAMIAKRNVMLTLDLKLACALWELALNCNLGCLSLDRGRGRPQEAGSHELQQLSLTDLDEGLLLCQV